METNFNFKSQICTSIEQSERLLSLGLKKETADCYWWQETDQYGDGNGKWHLEVLDTKEAREHFEYLDKIFDDELFIPAWSLGRLLELIKHSDICNYNDFGCIKLYIDLDDFETCITMISYMVKEGYFNTDYLNETTEN